MRKLAVVLFLCAALLLLGCSQPDLPLKATPSPSATPAYSPTTAPSVTATPSSTPVPTPTPRPEVWKNGGAVISGKYADAEVVDAGDGAYRMYYSAEPEVAGFEGQMYSATSRDGIAWVPEGKMLKTWAVTPSVSKLQDGRYRLYFGNQGVIKSALSNDGLSWTDEDGVRADTANSEGLALESVVSPTVLHDGSEYILVYRGTVNQRYSPEVPNSNTQLFFWAVSKDGVTFEKKGIALDSRNAAFNGLVDGPELVKWDDGSIRLYFWSYKGAYHTTFGNGTFSQDAVLDYTTNLNPMAPFSENPPSDPALAKINNTWFMYYGQHTKGIYYAILGR